MRFAKILATGFLQATWFLPLAGGIADAHASELILTHARVYASPDSAPLEDALVVVQDGRVASIQQASSKPAISYPRTATVIDCSGMSVTAGLWNSHVHILPVELLHAKEKTASQLTSALQEMLTRWGFTTVFDIASVLANTNVIRTRIASGEIPGPRILTTGEPFFPLHGVPSYVSNYLAENRIILPDDLTTAAAVERVRREIRAGADGIKIFAGSIEGDDVLLMPLERARAIVEEAHRLHRPIFVHPSNQAGIDIALKSGADVLAHVTSDEQEWAPALVERMRAAHMSLIPTLTLFDVEAKNGGAALDLEQKIVDRAVARLRAYNASGGDILFGTDVGYIYQFDTSEEYALMQRAGMSFPQILASLTTNPARRFGFGDRSGRIAVTMDADLTVFRGDPGTDISAFSRVRYTIRAGRVIYRATSE
jgi:imidazolonepropionase-like amidohydrolase